MVRSRRSGAVGAAVRGAAWGWWGGAALAGLPGKAERPSTLIANRYL